MQRSCALRCSPRAARGHPPRRGASSSLAGQLGLRIAEAAQRGGNSSDEGQHRWSVDRFFDTPSIAARLKQRAAAFVRLDAAAEEAHERIYAWLKGDRGSAHGLHSTAASHATPELAAGIVGGFTGRAATRLAAYRALGSDVQQSELLPGTKGGVVTLTSLAVASPSSPPFSMARRGHDWFVFVLHKHATSLDSAVGALIAAAGGAESGLRPSDFAVNVALDDRSCTTQLCTVRCGRAELLATMCARVNASATPTFVQPIGFVRRPCDLVRGATTAAVRTSVLLRGINGAPREITRALRAVGETGAIDFFGPRRIALRHEGAEAPPFGAHHAAAAARAGDFRAAMWMLHEGGELDHQLREALLGAVRGRVVGQRVFRAMYEEQLPLLVRQRCVAALAAAEWNLKASLRWRAAQLGARCGVLGAPGDALLLQHGNNAGHLLAKLELAHTGADAAPLDAPLLADRVLFVDTANEHSERTSDVTELAVPLGEDGAFRRLAVFPRVGTEIREGGEAGVVVRVAREPKAGTMLQLATDADIAQRQQSTGAAAPSKPRGPIGRGLLPEQRLPEGTPLYGCPRSRSRAVDPHRSALHCALLQLDLPASSYLSSVLRSVVELRLASAGGRQSSATRPLSSVDEEPTNGTAAATRAPCGGFADDTDAGDLMGFRWKTGETLRAAVHSGAASSALRGSPELAFKYTDIAADVFGSADDLDDSSTS